ncbi:MAG: rhamnulokinase family protein [Candidatus Limnocylindrales bacterium]
MTGSVAAVDLGASSGRVVVGRVGPRTLELTEAHRFANEPVTLPDGLHWDVLRLYREITEGLRRAARLAPGLVSVGVDGWGVDYGLLDASGRLLGNPYHYRDERTVAGMARVRARVPRERLYAVTGTQFMPINTVYQLAAALGTAELDAAAWLLLVPDLVGYWLAGGIHAEATNASTTGLFDAAAGTWSRELVEALDLPTSILPDLVHAGDPLGVIRPAVAAATGLPAATRLTAVGSHDTASAVVGVPAEGERFAYISCGTWALVGVELGAPILTLASQEANFTNELGVDGRIRYLRNVMGLWLLQESVHAWELEDGDVDLAGLLLAAAASPSGSIIDPDEPAFLPPGDMPARIAASCRATDQPVPPSRPALVRCILDSLAVAFARAVSDARRLSGLDIEAIHIVGGGSRNDLLCQLTADACDVPVVAGPVEATALGNVLVQGRNLGLIGGDLAALRSVVRRTQPLRRFEPMSRRPALDRSRGSA